MPPVEEGERCHVCDQSAWGLTNHICWCRECALALLPVRNVFALMIVPKCAVAMDAHLHANRWIRILLRLIAEVVGTGKVVGGVVVGGNGRADLESIVPRHRMRCHTCYLTRDGV